MNGFLRSKLVSVLAALVMIAAAIAVSLVGTPIHTNAAPWAALASSVTITEFQIPTGSSQPRGITSGPNGNLWFVEEYENKIGQIIPSGKITEYPITSNSCPNDIATGPDGKLWFTEGCSNKIGKITTSGAVTEYPVPTANSGPGGIANGPDGNLWFTEGPGNKIGKITTSGTISEYPIPTGGSDPSSITAGPDGNLWFTENVAKKVGKITTGGSITEYSVPTNSPTDITKGPDGNLWFTEIQGNKIGKITTTGTVTEYSLPTANSGPTYITAGPDGNLWFTEYNGNKIGKMNTTGSITEYPVPTSNSVPYGITTGPDGNLWFTEESGNKIGRASYPTVTVPNIGWAGYATSGSAYPNPSQPTQVLYSDVKGSWKVPASTCGSTEQSYATFWVGLGGTQGQLEQIGTLTHCSKGSLTYDPVYEVIVNGTGSVVYIDKGFPNDTVKPGDPVTAEVKYLGSGKYQLFITNSRSSTGWSFHTAQIIGSTSGAAHNSADWIAEAPTLNGSVQPLTYFGTVSFTGCKVDGKAVTSGPTINKFVMTVGGSPSGSNKAVPTSPLTGVGTAFNVKWISSGP